MVRPTGILLVSVLVLGACGSQHGRAKAKLAASGPIEASWPAGRDESRAVAISFVVVRAKGRLTTHIIEAYDDGREETRPIGYIDTDRCVMEKVGNAPQLWPDGPGKRKSVSMGTMADVPTDCSEYAGTPAEPLLPKH
jgi:hypothetical protein